jgi:hypothetical protein
VASIRIPFLVGKTNKAGLTSWYWQPSAAVKKKGWSALALGQGGTLDAPPEAVLDAARAQNRKLQEAEAAGARPAAVRRLARPLTGCELIDRFEAAGYPSVKRPGQAVEPATQRQYKSKLKVIRAWFVAAKDPPAAAITAQRVAAFRDALMAPAKSGPREGEVRRHAAHETLRVGRTLFSWAERQGLRPKGSNPFDGFALAAPDPRDHIWWPPAREAIMAQAEEGGELNFALAIDLAFQTGQREADLLRTIVSQYQLIPRYKMDPDVHDTLAAVPVPAIAGRAAYAPGDVWGIRLRTAKGKRWVEVPVVGVTRARVEAAIAAAKAKGLTTLLFDESSSTTWTSPNPEAGQRRFIRRFAELRSAAIASLSSAGEEQLAADIDALQYRDFRRTAVVYLGELGLADQLISAITTHSLDTTKKILETYMPRTTGMAARAIALSHARGAPQSGTSRREGEKK